MLVRCRSSDGIDIHPRALVIPVIVMVLILRRQERRRRQSMRKRLRHSAALQPAPFVVFSFFFVLSPVSAVARSAAHDRAASFNATAVPTTVAGVVVGGHGAVVVVTVESAVAANEHAVAQAPEGPEKARVLQENGATVELGEVPPGIG